MHVVDLFVYLYKQHIKATSLLVCMQRFTRNSIPTMETKCSAALPTSLLNTIQRQPASSESGLAMQSLCKFSTNRREGLVLPVKRRPISQVASNPKTNLCHKPALQVLYTNAGMTISTFTQSTSHPCGVRRLRKRVRDTESIIGAPSCKKSLRRL